MEETASDPVTNQAATMKSKHDSNPVKSENHSEEPSSSVKRPRSRYIVSRLIKLYKNESTGVLDDLFGSFQLEFVLRSMLQEWHLNTIKSRACSLAVWAVDQGNRKVYEMERALMAENSWIARSIVWDGFSSHPLTGITESKAFWASSAAKELGDDRVSILCEKLQVRHDYCSLNDRNSWLNSLQIEKQRNEVLVGQLALAREQLIEWQVSVFSLYRDSLLLYRHIRRMAGRGRFSEHRWYMGILKDFGAGRRAL
jgi:hypothetical protein